MGFLSEFKKFAARGNLLELATAFILGLAFNRIIQSLVNDIMMPPISLAVGDQRLADRFLTLRGGDYATLEQARAAGAVTLNYGAFLVAALEFVLIAFAIFMVVRTANRLHAVKTPKATAPTTKSCPYCASTIPLAALRCPHCTSDFGRSAPAMPSP